MTGNAVALGKGRSPDSQADQAWLQLARCGTVRLSRWFFGNGAAMRAPVLALFFPTV
jgi:hypothetical protein